MENQTAVDYAISKLEKFIEPGNQLVIRVIRDNAKDMEKQQIIDAHVFGDENHTFNSMMREEYANDYYKETYGK